LPGNGSAELIQMIALAFAQSGSRHLIIAPTFGEYDRALYLMEGRVREFRPETGLRFEPEAVIAAAKKYRPDTVWLCNPNNPTGQQWQADELDALQAAAPNALWIIDEAYRHFSVQTVSAWTGAPNRLVLRSLTKDYTLAGIRLGYIVAAPEIITALRKVQIPWSVNSLAQIAGAAALQPSTRAWCEQTLADLRAHAAQLWDDLRLPGLEVCHTDTTFALINVGSAAQFRARLLSRRLLVRDATSFGLPRYVRVAARLPEENRQLVEAVRQIQKEI
jgi:histidinol-phosphate/aromatic aminotransferase/cobyric acid decarboxylase-like protein